MQNNQSDRTISKETLDENKKSEMKFESINQSSAT